MIYQAYFENPYTNIKLWLPYYGANEESVKIKIAAAGETLNTYFIEEVKEIQRYSDENNLTIRENQILIHLVNGLDNKQIAAKLKISDKTIKNHISNIYKKLDVSNRSALISKMLKIRISQLENELRLIRSTLYEKA